MNKNLVSASSNLEINIFLPEAIDQPAQLTLLGQRLGVKFTAAKWYQDWDTDFESGIARGIAGADIIPELTWQPQINGGCVLYRDVTAGAYDAYLNDFIQDIKQTNIGIRITLAPEMNGVWAAWSVGNCGNTAADFIAFWRYVIDKFRSQNAPVEWIWSPNIHHWSETTTFSAVYPGDAYVDFSGVEGYNWGTSQGWSEWQSFKEVFLSSYNDLITLSGKNIIITEMASTEIGGNKAQWILDMFTELKTTFPRISGITWFNINKETDWRINSSTASEAAFREGVRKFFTIDNPIVNINQRYSVTQESDSASVQKIDKSAIAQNENSELAENNEQTNETKKSDSISSDSDSEIQSNTNLPASSNQSQAIFFIIWLGSIMTLLPITIWLAVK